MKKRTCRKCHKPLPRGDRRTVCQDCQMRKKNHDTQANTPWIMAIKSR